MDPILVSHFLIEILFFFSDVYWLVDESLVASGGLVVKTHVDMDSTGEMCIERQLEQEHMQQVTTTQQVAITKLFWKNVSKSCTVWYAKKIICCSFFTYRTVHTP